MRNFDVFCGIDWSGAKSPVNTKSIAVSVCSRAPNSLELFPDIRSRQAVADWIEVQAKSLVSKRMFIGIDCNFGYARKIGAKQFGVDYSYRDLWTAVEDANQDTPNFFAGGFWGHSTYKDYFWETGKKPEGFDMPRRVTETACGEAGIGWPESPFKLIGAKQVGKGGLAGMRMAYYLKQKLGDQICFWPFERELADKAQIVISEIYPRQFIKRAGLGNKKLDAYSLNEALAYFKTAPLCLNSVSDHDADALVSAAGLRYWCGEDVHIPNALSHPKQLSEKEALTEGWIFGVGY